MKKVMLIVSVTGILVILLTACGGALTENSSGVARPSNPGDPGEAIKLTGDPVAGKIIFDANCPVCHGEDGRGGVENPNSVDGTVPPLNPAEPDLWNANLQTFAYNADLFIEHGSIPDHSDPSILPDKRMIAWGNSGVLKPQDIADVIAYIYSLNK